MRRRLGATGIREGLAACAIIAIAVSGAGCDWLSPTQQLLPSAGGVTLRIENQSGYDISVEIVYLQDSSLIRRTQRLLPAAGPESVEEIVPTPADTVIASAWIALGTETTSALTAGGLFRAEVYKRGIDYEEDGTIVFIIAAAPAPEPDDGCSGDCIIIGDLNGDQAVDLLDVPLFTAVLLGTNKDPTAIRRCDFNLDGVADGRDAQGFTACLVRR